MRAERTGQGASQGMLLVGQQPVRLVSWVRATLARAGIDVGGFHGSGSDPAAGWVRVWWGTADKALIVRFRDPQDPADRIPFRWRVEGVLGGLGLVPCAVRGGYVLGAFNRALDLEWQLQQATHRVWEWSPVDWGYASGDLVLCDAEHGGYRLERGGAVLMPWVMPRDGEGLAGEDQAAFHVRLAGRVAAALRGAGAS